VLIPPPDTAVSHKSAHSDRLHKTQSKFDNPRLSSQMLAVCRVASRLTFVQIDLWIINVSRIVLHDSARVSVIGFERGLYSSS
jgi:hypothetical protein